METTKTKQTTKTEILVTCAMLISLSAMLSIFPTFNGMWPNGGSITVCSMLPIVLISHKYGIRWGLLSAFAFALIQLLSGLRGIAGMDAMSTFLVIFIDYIVAYTVLGFGGIFKGKFKSSALELTLGAFFALTLRFVSHFFSGYILFSSYAEWFFTQEGFTLGNSIFSSFGNSQILYILYSILYNASYMVPEIIITCSVSFILAKTGVFNKLKG